MVVLGRISWVSCDLLSLMGMDLNFGCRGCVVVTGEGGGVRVMVANRYVLLYACFVLICARFVHLCASLCIFVHLLGSLYPNPKRLRGASLCIFCRFVVYICAAFASHLCAFSAALLCIFVPPSLAIFVRCRRFAFVALRWSSCRVALHLLGSLRRWLQGILPPRNGQVSSRGCCS